MRCGSETLPVPAGNNKGNNIFKKFGNTGEIRDVYLYRPLEFRTEERASVCRLRINYETGHRQNWNRSKWKSNSRCKPRCEVCGWHKHAWWFPLSCFTEVIHIIVSVAFCYRLGAQYWLKCSLFSAMFCYYGKLRHCPPPT